jgi:hypothetical protein
MPSPSTITPIRTCHRIKLGTHEMPASGSTMTAAAEDADLINKVRLFHQAAR